MGVPTFVRSFSVFYDHISSHRQFWNIWKQWIQDVQRPCDFEPKGLKTARNVLKKVLIAIWEQDAAGSSPVTSKNSRGAIAPLFAFIKRTCFGARRTRMRCRWQMKHSSEGEARRARSGSELRDRSASVSCRFESCHFEKSTRERAFLLFTNIVLSGTIYDVDIHFPR